MHPLISHIFKNPNRTFFAILILFCITLSTGISYATLNEPKHIILMISDGQGMGTVMATNYYQGEKARYESFPVRYYMTTYSKVGYYNPKTAWSFFENHTLNPTDSAAAASAMATGQKTFPGAISTNFLGEKQKNIVEIASQYGLATGVVTSVPFSHATPAGMSVHNISRNNFKAIANDMLTNSELDVILGCGHPLFDDNGQPVNHEEADYQYVGGKDLFFSLMNGLTAKDGETWSFVDTLADFENIASGAMHVSKLIGLPQTGKTLQQKRNGDPQQPYSDAFNAGIPSLSLLTQTAISTLAQDQDGFFLMVEGGAVDWANHDNQKGRLIEEQTDFNNSVATVIDWIENPNNNSNWNNTLLIVTSDHECGYIWGTESRDFTPVMDNGPGTLPEFEYHSSSHSNLPVPLYAKGRGSDLFTILIDGFDPMLNTLFSAYDPGLDGSYIDNTDVFTAMNLFISDGVTHPANGRWFKGDLHAHSLHSDGDSSVSDVIQSVAEKGLDFFALTDHDSDMFEKNNDDNINPPHWDDPDYASDNTVLLYGIEWTTERGHANIWSSAPFDYTALWEANNDEDAYRAMREAHEQSALFSINHPSAVFCCPWEYDVEPETNAIEIWNAMYRLPNFNAWASNPFWDRQLRQGRRITGVGGSDTHELKGIQSYLFGHGNPTTWVYAEKKEANAILKSIEDGHVSISCAPDAPRLSFSADSNNDNIYEAMIGDNILLTQKKEFSFKIGIHDPQANGDNSGSLSNININTLLKLANGDIDFWFFVKLLFSSDYKIAVVYKNGLPFKAWLTKGNVSEITFKDTPASTGHTYYRVKLLGKPSKPTFATLLHGRMIALTNPIYINFPN